MQHSVAVPYSRKVIKAHHCIFLGSKDTWMKATWGVITPLSQLDIEGLKNKKILISCVYAENVINKSYRILRGLVGPVLNPNYCLCPDSEVLCVYATSFEKKCSQVATVTGNVSRNVDGRKCTEIIIMLQYWYNHYLMNELKFT